MMKKIRRIVQLLTFVHRIHHIRYGYGYRVSILGLTRFDKRGWSFVWRWFHDCTWSGVY